MREMVRVRERVARGKEELLSARRDRTPTVLTPGCVYGVWGGYW